MTRRFSATLLGAVWIAFTVGQSRDINAESSTRAQAESDKPAIMIGCLERSFNETGYTLTNVIGPTGAIADRPVSGRSEDLTANVGQRVVVTGKELNDPWTVGSAAKDQIPALEVSSIRVVSTSCR